MNGAVVPTTHGYALVVLRSDLRQGGPLTIRTPVGLADDVRIQVRGQFLSDISRYLWEISRWEGIGFVALAWAVFSIATLAASSIWDYGWRLIGLYGWVRLWFLGDGIWLLCQYLAKTKDRAIAATLRKSCEYLFLDMIRAPGWPTLEDGQETDEIAYIRDMMTRYPHTAPYYGQILTIDPPRIMETLPLKILPRIRNLLLGPPVRPPAMVYYVGRLEQ